MYMVHVFENNVECYHVLTVTIHEYQLVDLAMALLTTYVRKCPPCILAAVRIDSIFLTKNHYQWLVIYLNSGARVRNSAI